MGDEQAVEEKAKVTMEHCKNSETGNGLNACTCDGQEQPKRWPPPKHELDKFRCVVGNYVFVLESLLKGRVTLTLQYTFGVRSDIHPVASTEQDFDWRVSCRFKYASAVAATIPRAEVFLRNWYEKKPLADHNHERPPLPDGCEWVDGVFGASVRDDRYTTLYTLPQNERHASILDALAKEFRRTNGANYSR